MLLVTFKTGDIFDLIDLSIDPGSYITTALETIEKIFVLTLASSNHRREDLDPGPGGKIEYRIDYLVSRLRVDPSAAIVTEGCADTGE